jgi:hypothetical protein
LWKLRGSDLSTRDVVRRCTNEYGWRSKEAWLDVEKHIGGIKEGSSKRDKVGLDAEGVYGVNFKIAIGGNGSPWERQHSRSKSIGSQSAQAKVGRHSILAECNVLERSEEKKETPKV